MKYLISSKEEKQINIQNYAFKEVIEALDHDDSVKRSNDNL